MTILDKKLEKLRKLSEDTSTTENERELAYKRYVEFKEKYQLKDNEEEEKRYFIRTKNIYEKSLLCHILWSFNIENLYFEKRCSKNKIIFYCTEETYLAILDDFEFHKNNLHNILDGITTKYLHTQIKPPILTTEDNKTLTAKYDKNFLKAYFGSAWLDDIKYKNKIRLEFKEK